MSSGPVVYGDYTRDRRGVAFGLSGGQLGVCVALAAPFFLSLAASRWLLLLPSLLLLAVGWALVLVRVNGRTSAQWAADASRHVVGSRRGWLVWRSRATSGLTQPSERPDLPGVLSQLVTHDGPMFGGSSGPGRPVLIQDEARSTWAATARVLHPGVGLASGADRARLGQGLASLLEVAARTERADQVVFTVRVAPDDGAQRAAYLARRSDPNAPAAAVVMARELESTLLPVCPQSQTFVTVVAREKDLGREAGRLGGGVAGRAAALHGLMREVETQLVGAVGCEKVTWLTSAGLAEAIRTGFAPGDRSALTSAAIGASEQADAGLPVTIATGVPMAAAGPMQATARARGYVHDGWHSASFVVLLPDEGSSLGALLPVVTLSAAGEGRALSVFYPVTVPSAATRTAERESAGNSLGMAINKALKRETTAREQRAQASAAGRRHKVAAGRTITRPAAIASITVPVDVSLPDAAARLEASIRQAGFVPQRVDFAQDAAFVASAIPVGVGITAPRTLWSRS